MTWLLLATVAGTAFLVGSIGGFVASALARIASETDAAERAAWNLRRRAG